MEYCQFCFYTSSLDGGKRYLTKAIDKLNISQFTIGCSSYCKSLPVYFSK